MEKLTYPLSPGFHFILHSSYLSHTALPFPPAATSTLPAFSNLYECHQQSEAVFGAVRSGCSLRNGVRKLPYMAMAAVTLATSCP